MDQKTKDRIERVRMRLFQAWDENPWAVIAVLSLATTSAVTAVSKISMARSASRNSKAWKMEVERRIRNSQR